MRISGFRLVWVYHSSGVPVCPNRRYWWESVGYWYEWYSLDWRWSLFAVCALSVYWLRSTVVGWDRHVVYGGGCSICRRSCHFLMCCAYMAFICSLDCFFGFGCLGFLGNLLRTDCCWGLATSSLVSSLSAKWTLWGLEVWRVDLRVWLRMLVKMLETNSGGVVNWLSFDPRSLSKSLTRSKSESVISLCLRLGCAGSSRGRSLCSMPSREIRLWVGQCSEMKCRRWRGNRRDLDVSNFLLILDKFAKNRFVHRKSSVPVFSSNGPRWCVEEEVKIIIPVWETGGRERKFQLNFNDLEVVVGGKSSEEEKNEV